jgi:RNA polymerase I-specific transcription initiation factor RRN3
MDPHSTRSQFNTRRPKAGPSKMTPYEAPLRIVPTLDKEKAQNRSTPSRKSSTASSVLSVHRPIATNSRVKHDEQLKKDMYLSFVNNALQQKALVSSGVQFVCHPA